MTVGYAGRRDRRDRGGLRQPSAVQSSSWAGRDGTIRYTDERRAILATGAAFGGEVPTTRPVPADRPGPFAQWVDHIRAGTRADDNIARAVELTRLVVAANRAAAEGRSVAYRG